jgi:CheY-like chemotaxis protein
MSTDGVDIVLVDDEQDAREALETVLRASGYVVLGARNGEAALTLLREGARPRLIVLDLNMPVMNGWGFLREIEQDRELAQVPIAFISGTGLQQSVPTRKHDAGFFKKPLDMPRLLRMVRTCCGDRRR